MRNPEVLTTKHETLDSQSKASHKRGAFVCKNRRLDLSAPLKGMNSKSPTLKRPCHPIFNLFKRVERVFT